MNLFEKPKSNIKKFNDFSTDRPYTFFCDMDGVLTAFEENFMRISKGLTPDEYEAKNGKFSIWQLIEEHGIEWWSEMPWIEGGKEIWNFINQNNDAIICSSPSRSPLSSKGKIGRAHV